MGKTIIGKMRLRWPSSEKPFTYDVEIDVESETRRVDDSPLIDPFEQEKRAEYHRTLHVRVKRYDELIKKFTGSPDATYWNVTPALRKAVQHIVDQELGFPWS